MAGQLYCVVCAGPIGTTTCNSARREYWESKGLDINCYTTDDEDDDARDERVKNRPDTEVPGTTLIRMSFTTKSGGRGGLPVASATCGGWELSGRRRR
ncbi:hypothetical protein BDW62DRAFT_174461 [Aspergillus aurantiobrunneus]